jgi:hypothetical protein
MSLRPFLVCSKAVNSRPEHQEGVKTPKPMTMAHYIIDMYRHEQGQRAEWRIQRAPCVEYDIQTTILAVKRGASMKRVQKLTPHFHATVIDNQIVLRTNAVPSCDELSYFFLKTSLEKQ